MEWWHLLIAIALVGVGFLSGLKQRKPQPQGSFDLQEWSTTILAAKLELAGIVHGDPDKYKAIEKAVFEQPTIAKGERTVH